MNDFKFIKYEPVKATKYVGIFTVIVRGVILRYKIVKVKDGEALFPAAASYKISGDDEEGKYLSAFSLDSQSEKEMLFDFIKEKMNVICPKSAQKLNTFNDQPFNNTNTQENKKTQPMRSNEEIQASDDLPF